MEREADRIGYNVAGQAGFKPAAFVSMFEKLQQASRLSDSGAYPYLRSHPLTSARIADMQLRLKADDTAPGVQLHGEGQVAPLNASALDLTHNMMAARARILADPGVDNLRAWLLEAGASASVQPPNALAKQVFVLYGAVLASLKLRELTEARRWLEALQNSVRFAKGASGEVARQVRMLRIEVALQTGDLNQAVSLLDPLATDRPELLLRSQVAVQWRRQSLGSAADARISGGAGELLADALQRLQTWVHGHPDDALAWQWLANVAAAQNLTLRALRAEAEVHVANLDLPAAVDRFKAAQDYAHKNGLGAQPGDHIEASIIDTRLRQVAAQSRELSREQALQR
jgi:predicted Zn-dependent protease